MGISIEISLVLMTSVRRSLTQPVVICMTEQRFVVWSGGPDPSKNSYEDSVICIRNDITSVSVNANV